MIVHICSSNLSIITFGVTSHTAELFFAINLLEPDCIPLTIFSRYKSASAADIMNKSFNLIFWFSCTSPKNSFAYEFFIMTYPISSSTRIGIFTHSIVYFETLPTVIENAFLLYPITLSIYINKNIPIQLTGIKSLFSSDITSSKIADKRIIIPINANERIICLCLLYLKFFNPL